MGGAHSFFPTHTASLAHQTKHGHDTNIINKIKNPNQEKSDNLTDKNKKRRIIIKKT